MNKSSSTPADRQADALAADTAAEETAKTAPKKSSGTKKTASSSSPKSSEKAKTASKTTSKKTSAASGAKSAKTALTPDAEATADPAPAKKKSVKRAVKSKTDQNAAPAQPVQPVQPAQDTPKTRAKSATASKKAAPEAAEAAKTDESPAQTPKAKAKPQKTAAKTSAKSRNATASTPSAVEAAPQPDADIKIDAPALEAADKKADAPAKKPAAPKKTAAKKSVAPKDAAGPESTGSTAAAAADTEQQASEFTVADLPPAEASAESAPAQEAKPKSGRGRRGGRRRNGKSGNGTGTADAAAVSEQSENAEKNLSAGRDAKTQPTAQTDPAHEATLESEPVNQEAQSDRHDGQRKHKSGRDKQDAKQADHPREEENVQETPKGKRKMFVSVLPGEQVEVAIAEEGVVQEYYVEMLHQVKIKGNIYKGVIHNVDPNLQAAFVSYGAVKNGFLQIDEVHPEYYLTPHEQGKGHKYPLIQKVLKPGQEILVQVVKEPSGTKGAFLTSYLSLPGRFLVLTPGREQIGVSRKVENDEERGRLRDLLSGLNPGPGLGVIVRTVSMGASKTNLQRDLQFLKRVWRDVRKKGSTEKAPALIYQELDLAARSVRDYLTEDIVELWVDDVDLGEQIKEVIAMLFPRRSGLLQTHDPKDQDLFERFGLKKQLEQVQSREVVLPSGARLVFDHTEALTAIDINSGKTAGKTNFEDMAFRINLEAAQNIPLQLRLRDIGGQIIVDFIEMRDRNHWREVERAFRNGMRHDRARHDVAKISSFGLLQVVRQRLGSSALSQATELCPYCRGTGQRRNMEWQSLQALKDIQRLIRQHHDNNGKTIHYANQPELILYLLNHKKERLLDMEKESGLLIELRPEA